MLLSSYLKRDNNNLDLVRIIAACMVIYGHAYAISPQVGSSDLVHQLLGFEYSGSLAVKIFFFISGLVVSNSFYTKRNVNDFVCARFFRIWPALIAVVTLGYLIGIIITSASDFTEQVPFIPYLIKSIILDFTWVFPGVFDQNSMNVFNGSLWTIIYEVGAYIVLMSCFSLLRFNKIAITLVCLIIIFDSVLFNGFMIKLASLNEEVKYLPACFALGALSAIYKDNIDISGTNLLMLILLASVFSAQESGMSHLLFYVSFMYAILYVSSTKLMLFLKVKHDISYGVYLWGFPIQQLVAMKIGSYGVAYNQIISIILSLLAGFLSWIIIEKRFIAYGRNLLKQSHQADTKIA